MTLGRTPAQATGLNLPIDNGWGDMIQWSILDTETSEEVIQMNRTASRTPANAN